MYRYIDDMPRHTRRVHEPVSRHIDDKLRYAMYSDNGQYIDTVILCVNSAAKYLKMF